MDGAGADAGAGAAGPGAGAGPARVGRRSKSETAVNAQAKLAFMVSSEQRLQDAENHLRISTAEHRRLLHEELQGWYFSPGEVFDLEVPFAALEEPPKSDARPNQACSSSPKPEASMLEEAAAAIRAAKAGGAYPSSGNGGRNSFGRPPLYGGS